MPEVQHQNSCVNGIKCGLFSNPAAFKQSRLALRDSLPM